MAYSLSPSSPSFLSNLTRSPVTLRSTSLPFLSRVPPNSTIDSSGKRSSALFSIPIHTPRTRYIEPVMDILFYVYGEKSSGAGGGKQGPPGGRGPHACDNLN